MKLDESIIRAALSNLPRTLDETYERIFLSIPEEDWLSVQHVFHWMVYHSEIFAGNIPLSTLLQAVQQSTMDSLSHDADQLHDFDGLRERCGCLINIRQEEYSSHNLTVSFAHYTVKEYLESSRISQKKVEFFALTRARVQKQMAEVVFRQALALQPDMLPDNKLQKEEHAFHDIRDADFKIYCQLGSAVQLSSWSADICSEPTLIELSEMLVNPRRPAYEAFGRWVYLSCRHIFRNSYYTLSQFTSNFWIIKWTKLSDHNVAVFMHLLLVSEQLALAFATRHSMLGLLTEKVRLEKSKWILDFNENDDYGGESNLEYNGSIAEIIAQWSEHEPRTLNCLLDLISAHGVNHFDLSTVLLRYISCHQHSNCKELCPLEKLLSLGASANGPEETFVTPLQIAVLSWDLPGVETLINADADLDSVGGCGSKFADNSAQEPLNELHGMSPLYLIRHYESFCSERWRMLVGREESIRKRIEARLLEWGTTEIPHMNENSKNNDLETISDEIQGKSP